MITSSANPHIKDLRKLEQTKERRASGNFLAEGLKAVGQAFDSGAHVHELLVAPEILISDYGRSLVERAREKQIPVLELSPSVFATFARKEKPQGIAALVAQNWSDFQTDNAEKGSFWVAIESIQNPGNLGTILRSADSAGAAAVIVCDHCTDIQNPNVVRASIGTLFSVPVVDTSTAEAIAFLRERGFRILAATPHATALYTDFDLAGDTAIVVGAEQYGLSDAWLQSDAIQPVRIPMLGQCDSLNVASATTILLYEAVRQRVAKNPALVPPPHVHEHGGDDPHADD